MNLFKRLACAALAPALISSAASAALLTDDFNTAGSAANYNVVVTSADTAITYAYDYGAFGIPAAPNTTDNSTLGVKMEVNLAAPNAREAITFHTNQSFSGKYRIKLDAWINANGPFPLGGAGSTEYLTFGVGGDGATANLHNLSAGSPIGTGSGGWFAVDGEGQSSQVDYVALKDATLQTGTTGQYSASNVDGAGGARDNSNAYYLPISAGVDVDNLPYQGAAIPVTGFAQQNGDTEAGTFGFAWHEVTIDVDSTGGTGGAGSATWYIDGLKIATLDAGANGAFSTSGRATFGYMDSFTSVSNNAALSFGLIDNLEIEAVPEPGSLALAATALGLFFAQKRRSR